MPTLAGAAVDDAAAAGSGSGLGATGTGGGGSGVLGADGPTGAGAGEAVGRGATDVTAEWGDATLGALIVSLGGAFLAPVTRFGFAFSALTFVARPAVVFVAGFLAFVACLAGCFAAAALPVFQLAAATGLTGCLAAVLRPSFFVAFGVMYEKEHSAMQLHRLPCSIEAEARHCARREFTSARRNQLARVGVGKRQRELMQTWIVTDQKHAVP